jgi:hypothetical protein
MKKQTAILAVAMAAAFAAPAFATLNTAPGAKQSQSDQVSAKAGKKKPGKAKTPKAPKA